jgi:YD repeat-containing protein
MNKMIASGRLACAGMLLTSLLWLGACLDAGALSLIYSYDAAGRLVAVDYGGGSRVAYTYDAAGNLLREQSAGPQDQLMPDITLSSEPVPNLLPAGIPFDLHFLIANQGLDLAPEVTFDYAIPDGMSVLSAMTGLGTIVVENGRIHGNLGIVGVGTAIPVELRLLPTQPGDFSSQFLVQVPGDVNPSNNVWQTSLPILPDVDLAVVADFYPLPALPSQTITARVMAINVGKAPADGVILSNTLPSHVELIEAQVNQGAYELANQTLIARFGALQPGQAAILDLKLKPTQLGAQPFGAVLWCQQTDVVPTNNQTSRIVRVSEVTRWVVNTNDTGPGSLRQAVLEANAAPGLDVIGFNIPGDNVPIIIPADPLPIISDPVVVDATTQPAGRVHLRGEKIPSENHGLHISAGESTVRGMIISRFTLGGQVYLAGGGTNVIQNCWFGTDATGTTNYGWNTAGQGVRLLNSAGNQIGGLLPVARNVIVDSRSEGITITGTGSVGNRVIGNLLGLAPVGGQVLANGYGVAVYAPDNMIGEAVPGGGNVIAGSTYTGIQLEEAANRSVICGNYVGVDASGIRAISNGGYGIYCGRNTGVVIGGDTPWARNVVCASTWEGVLLAQSSKARVQGNYIGVDATGTNALSNSYEGVAVYSNTDTIVGGAGPYEGNVISGNKRAGIRVWFYSTYPKTEGLVIVGNRLGTDATGSRALPNSDGIILLGATGTQIGGDNPGLGNLISGNLAEGIYIANASSTNFLIAGNRIGTDFTGTQPLGNGTNGVTLKNTSGHLLRQNVIAFNQGHGIQVVSDAFNNTFQANAIFQNQFLGIKLGSADNQPLANDVDDADDGPNRLQNHPVLNNILNAKGEATGSLQSSPLSPFRIEVFGSPIADASGFGEGQQFLAALDVMTDSEGQVLFAFPVNQVPSETQWLSATATDADGNTSEFGPAAAWDAVVVPPTPAYLHGYRMVAGGQFQFSIDNEPDHGLRIDVSTNLLDWIELISLPSLSGPFIFTDTNATLYPKRFYRVATPSAP